MALYKVIVVGTDGSGPARDAVRQAGELARAVGAEKIHVVMASRRIERAEVQIAMESIPEDWDADPDLYAGDRYVLAKASATLEPYGVPVETHLIADGAADALIAVAERTDADLIVVGSSGMGAGARLFLGSVSTKVVQHAHEHCSVLVTSHHRSIAER